jgi:hypothetical protein
MRVVVNVHDLRGLFNKRCILVDVIPKIDELVLYSCDDKEPDSFSSVSSVLMSTQPRKITFRGSGWTDAIQNTIRVSCIDPRRLLLAPRYHLVGMNVANLETIKLSGCKDINDHAIVQLCQYCGKHLRSLDLSYCSKLTESILDCVFQLCDENLSNLNLAGIDMSKSSHVLDQPHPRMRAKKLILNDCKMSHEVCQFISCSCGDTLSVLEAKGLKSELCALNDLAMVVSRCVELRELDLSRSIWTVQEFRTLCHGNLSCTLRWLKIRDCPHFNTATVWSILRHAPDRSELRCIDAAGTGTPLLKLVPTLVLLQNRMYIYKRRVAIVFLFLSATPANLADMRLISENKWNSAIDILEFEYNETRIAINLLNDDEARILDAQNKIRTRRKEKKRYEYEPKRRRVAPV